MPAKKGIAQQQHYSEYEHLGCEHAQHSSSDCEAGALTGIARDLSELDACEVNFLPRQVRSVFRHVAEELPDSAIGPDSARHLLA
jgi:hypothetical protein